jgi:hypothetical protein
MLPSNRANSILQVERERDSEEINDCKGCVAPEENSKRRIELT